MEFIKFDRWLHLHHSPKFKQINIRNARSIRQGKHSANTIGKWVLQHLQISLSLVLEKSWNRETHVQTLNQPDALSECNKKPPSSRQICSNNSDTDVLSGKSKPLLKLTTFPKKDRRENHHQFSENAPPVLLYVVIAESKTHLRDY
jgi:hypothetical protein